jgi:hypothetical protein
VLGAYTGGGGGGGANVIDYPYNASGGTGGTGGGGNGGGASGAKQAGTTNRGGGGGGARCNDTYGTAGGSGIVVIRYPLTYASATTSGASYTTDGTYRIYTFNSSGTITF